MIALTGTTGFLGSSLLKKLEEDPRVQKVVAIDTRTPPFKTKKTRFYRLDLTKTLADAALFEILQKEKVTTVLHTAFPITPTHDHTYTHELQSVGTMYLLDACSAVGIRKLVMASTTDVYGAHPSNPNFLSEDHPRRGGLQSEFLADKIDAEDQLLRFASKHKGTITTLLRPCTILGPTIRNFKTTFLQKQTVVTVMGYDPLFQFVHEGDVLRAFAQVIHEDHPGIFNIVGLGVLPLSKVLQLGKRVNLPVPAPLLSLAVEALWNMDLSPAPPSHIDFLKYLCVADGRKAESDLNFKPQHSSKEALLAFTRSNGYFPQERKDRR